MSPRRTDDNQTDIVKVIRQLGGEWIETSGDPRSGCDGILLFRGRSYVTEIKNGSLSASRRKLTDNEQRTQAKCIRTGSPYLVLTSPEHAIEVLRDFH